ncbi:MAG: site-specific DNA-methyltransferase [Calditrichaeota bacterium]|nr:site-specific DNA-methyltransferase [Calditrichota bacterium]
MEDWINQLHFGDNLKALKESIPDESVDLIYLDPPFNSNATYNVLFKERSGENSTAQITAFEDAWRWGRESEIAYRDLITGKETKLSFLMQAFRHFLGRNDMLAYLVMMAPRLVELHRVLKPTGSLFLHCDQTASHLIKLLLDAIFGGENFQNEIIWQKIRVEKAQSKRYPKLHDSIFFYSKSKNFKFYHQRLKPSEEYLKRFNLIEEETGRQYLLVNFFQGGQGPARRFGSQLISPPKGKHWIWGQARIDEAYEAGRFVFTASDKPRLKRYLDEHLGRIVGNIWTDIYPINPAAKERLGFPTQKPIALLTRIINSASDENDIVLDPFCGCGSTVVAAEKLNRRWIGIDITHLSITLIKNRLREDFKQKLKPFKVYGIPRDKSSAEALALENRHQFEWWAVDLVDARPAQDKRRGPDSGVDGVIFFIDDDSGIAKKIVVQVKSGDVSVQQIRDLRGVMEREDAVIGVFITLKQPSRQMRVEALAVGLYVPEHYPQYKCPRLQIFTIEELLSGKKLEYPSVAPQNTFDRPTVQNIKKRKLNPGSLILI